MKSSSDFSKENLGSSHGKAAEFCSKSLGSSTAGEQEASQSGGALAKVASVADGKGKTDSMGKATGSAPPAASTNMAKIRNVADGK